MYRKVKVISILILVVLIVMIEKKIKSETIYEYSFLNKGVGGRALSLAGAYVASVNDSTSGYWNPAGLSKLKKDELSFMYSNDFDGEVEYNFVGCGINLKKIGKIGIIWIRTTVKEIPITTLIPNVDFNDINGNGVKDPYEEIIINEERIEWWESSDNAFIFSYAYEIGKLFIKNSLIKLAIGINLKYITQSIGNPENYNMLFYKNGYDSKGGTIDIGMIFTYKNKINLGINFQNIMAEDIVWERGDEKYTPENVDMNIKGGISYLYKIPKQKWGSILGEIDMDSQSDGILHTGIEYSFFKRFALRGGIISQNIFSGDSNLKEIDFSAGAGIKLLSSDLKVKDSNIEFVIDYAYISYDLGNSHHISCTVRF